MHGMRIHGNANFKGGLVVRMYCLNYRRERFSFRSLVGDSVQTLWET